MLSKIRLKYILLPALTGLLIMVGCGSNKSQAAVPAGPRAVTADIKTAIEKHIEQEASRNDGYFELAFDERELHLKLVRVHIEYLAALGPELNFACVDLAGTDGEVYDVDFFMKGKPGDMSVTETTVHKINGQPLYAWEQKKDKTWGRVEVDAAAQHLLGVIEDKDEFEFRYDTKVPEIRSKGRMWIPLPVSDEFQSIKITSIKAPGKQTTLREAKYGNKVLFLELGPEDSNKPIEIRIQTKRLEKAAYAAPAPREGEYLDPNRLVPLTENFHAIAREVLKDKKGELVRARALYDHVIDRMAYKKVGKGWGQGDANFACDSRIGNCTDYHSYFIALARSSGIPARFAIGAGVPSARNDGGISGYHCWAEFYAEGKWWPVDISEGDKYSSLATYYFGHHPANRIEFSRGRDLMVDPAPKSGPINFFAYPVVEIDGQSVKLKPKFTFKRSS
ncbi:transglutaminase-like domain-containing protein [Planctomycetota bacterium]